MFKVAGHCFISSGLRVFTYTGAAVHAVLAVGQDDFAAKVGTEPESFGLRTHYTPGLTGSGEA